MNNRISKRISVNLDKFKMDKMWLEVTKYDVEELHIKLYDSQERSPPKNL